MNFHSGIKISGCTYTARISGHKLSIRDYVSLNFWANPWPTIHYIVFSFIGEAGRSILRVHRGGQDGVPAPRVGARCGEHGDGGAGVCHHDSHGGYPLICGLCHAPGPAPRRSGIAKQRKKNIKLKGVCHEISTSSFFMIRTHLGP